MKIELLKKKVIRFVPETSADYFNLGTLSGNMYNETHFAVDKENKLELVHFEISIDVLMAFLCLAKIPRKEQK